MTDIHDPTLNNAAHNARLNVLTSPSEEGEGEGEGEEEGCMKIKMTSRIDEKYLEEVIILSSDSENFVDPSTSMELESMSITDNNNISIVDNSNSYNNNNNNNDNNNNTIIIIVITTITTIIKS